MENLGEIKSYINELFQEYNGYGSAGLIEDLAEEIDDYIRDILHNDLKPLKIAIANYQLALAEYDLYPTDRDLTSAENLMTDEIEKLIK